MKPMNDQRFFDLAMKAIARQASDAERAELDALLAGNPALEAAFERLRAEAVLAKEALPLVEASAATGGKLPAYARGRLQTKVRESLRRPTSEAKQPDRSLAWGWRWWLGLAATATAVLVLAVVTTSKPKGPLVQIAMLDLVGQSRGADSNNVVALEQTWRGAKAQVFSKADELGAWEKDWPAMRTAVAKVIYDPAAAELRVLFRAGNSQTQMVVSVERDLPSALEQAQRFIQAQAGR